MKPKKTEMTDEEFFKMYETHQDGMAQDFLEKNLPDSRGSDFLENIEHFIKLRQSLKDSELEKLKTEAGKLFKRQEEIQFERIREEISCLRDITFLHKKLVEKDGKP